MRKIIIISGSQGVGKTTLANILMREKKHYTSKGERLFDFAKYMPLDTEVVLFDDVQTLKQIRSICSTIAVSLRRPYQKQIQEIEIPDIIITTSINALELESYFFCHQEIYFIDIFKSKKVDKALPF